MTAIPIRAFARGLDLLAALNRHGSATALTLARDTGIPRATVYRLLETLLAGGWIARSPSDDRFTLRLKLRTLSDGVEDEEWISAIAAPALFALILSGLMSFLVSGLSTFRATGWLPGFGGLWVASWLSAWLVAFPLVMAVSPLARRIVQRLTDKPR